MPWWNYVPFDKCRMFRVSLHEERRCIFHAVLHDVGARKSGQAMLDY